MTAKRDFMIGRTPARELVNWGVERGLIRFPRWRMTDEGIRLMEHLLIVNRSRARRHNARKA